MQIEEMNLDEVEDSLRTLTYEINAGEQMYESVQLEIAALKAKLDSMVSDRAAINRDLLTWKDQKQHLANRRELLLQEKMKDQAIQETAEKVYELLRDFEAWGKAHDYQKEDVISCIHAYLSGYSGFLNANDMGLGKTLESFICLKVLSILFEAEHNRKPKILWLTKTSLLKTGGTIREGQKWYPELKLVPVEGSQPKKDREAMFELINMFPNAAVITNYETCRTTDNLKNTIWDIIVMDEVHKLKGGANLSGPTAVWTAVKEVAENARMTIMLSGTPMVNRAGEMWAYLHIFDPERFPKLRQFEEMFQTYQRIGGEMQLAVDANKLLDKALVGRVCRRRKDEVGLQLPSITPYADREVLLEMLPRQREVYDQMRDQFFIWLQEQDDSVPLTATAIIAQLIRLRQINIWPVIDFKITDEDGSTRIESLNVPESSKIDEAMDDIINLQDQAVIFCSFNEPMREIQRRCKEEGIRCELLTGENSDNLYELEVGFQQGTIDVLCINSVMGEGLNLQKNPESWPGGSSFAGFLDLWYNPARNDQCTDRVFRQGAKEPVTIKHYKNESSVDQYIDAIIEKKFQEISGVMESEKLRPSDWAAKLKDLM